MGYEIETTESENLMDLIEGVSEWSPADESRDERGRAIAGSL